MPAGYWDDFSRSWDDGLGQWWDLEAAQIKGGYYEEKKKKTYYEIDGKVYEGTLYEIKKRLEELAKTRAVRAAKKASTKERIVEVKKPEVVPEIVLPTVAPLTVSELRDFYVNAFASFYTDRLLELRMRDEEEAELLLLL